MSNGDFVGNLSKAHKRIAEASTIMESRMTFPGDEAAALHVAIGFLHVFIELTAQVRDYVKNQTKDTS